MASNKNYCYVVPHAGTWIEIDLLRPQGTRFESFPTRERGLKYHCVGTYVDRVAVVPHAGTWIEIKSVLNDLIMNKSFSTRERGLKSVCK